MKIKATRCHQIKKKREMTNVISSISAYKHLEWYHKATFKILLNSSGGYHSGGYLCTCSVQMGMGVVDLSMACGALKNRKKNEVNLLSENFWGVETI